MNHDYDRALVVAELHTQIGQLRENAEHLLNHATALDDVRGVLTPAALHAWHTDNAADVQERVATSLEQIANDLRAIGDHVLYPRPPSV